MKKARRSAARAIIRFCDFANGYIAREFYRAAIIAVVTIPGCYIFLFASVALSQ